MPRRFTASLLGVWNQTGSEQYGLPLGKSEQRAIAQRCTPTLEPELKNRSDVPIKYAVPTARLAPGLGPPDAAAVVLGAPSSRVA